MSMQLPHQLAIGSRMLAVKSCSQINITTAGRGEERAMDEIEDSFVYDDDPDVDESVIW